MTGRELLAKLLVSYQSSYDIEQPFAIGEVLYDAHASFRVTSAKYVLVKKAELWRADCFEHVFFKCAELIDKEDITRFARQAVSDIEPEFVRKGKACPGKDHMYTYITGIFFSDKSVPEDVKQAVKKYRFVKNYRMGIRGYCEGRLLVFDLENGEIFGNRAAKALVKGYRQFVKQA